MKLIALLLIFAAASCPGTEKKNYDVAVSIVPQKYLVDRISGNTLSVFITVPPGRSPETFEITTRTMRDVAGAALYLKMNHLPFERTLLPGIQTANKNMQTADISAGINLIQGGNCGLNHDHSHLEADPHFWLSAREYVRMARNTCEALCRVWPDNSTVYKQNCSRLEADIQALDRRLKTSLSSLRGRTIIVFHPAWGYFARDYGLNQLAIEHEGKEPGAAHIKKLLISAKNEKAQIVLVQREFSADAARSIARDLGIRIAVLDPLAYNWFTAMQDIEKALTGNAK